LNGLGQLGRVDNEPWVDPFVEIEVTQTMIHVWTMTPPTERPLAPDLPPLNEVGAEKMPQRRPATRRPVAAVLCNDDICTGPRSSGDRASVS
jgi:hypothetical protein